MCVWFPEILHQAAYSSMQSTQLHYTHWSICIMWHLVCVLAERVSRTRLHTRMHATISYKHTTHTHKYTRTHTPTVSSIISDNFLSVTLNVCTWCLMEVRVLSTGCPSHSALQSTDSFSFHNTFGRGNCFFFFFLAGLLLHSCQSK